jgi:hypothetical protein
MTFTPRLHLSSLLALLVGCVTPDPPPPVVVRPPEASNTRPQKARQNAAPPAEAEPTDALGVPGPAVVQMALPAAGGASEGSLSITFADGSTRSVPLGRVPGTCTEVPPEPVKHLDKTYTPLFAYNCKVGERSGMGYLIQVDAAALVVSATASPTGATRFKTLKQIALAEGVVLSAQRD